MLLSVPSSTASHILIAKYLQCVDSTGGSRGSDYVNIGTPEEVLLENYFISLSGFKFQQARESCVSLKRARSYGLIMVLAMTLVYH